MKEVTANTDAMRALQPIRSLSVIGLGYIGLPTAAMFASHGVEVRGIDISPRVVEMINQGKPHIEEGDLDDLVEKCVRTGALKAYIAPQPADAFIIAVPTPVAHDDTHAPDISYVKRAGHAIAGVLKKGDLVILESTSPVGTTGILSELLAKARPDLKFPHQDAEEPDVLLAYCPERIIPGQMLRELVENDRIIGGMTTHCAERAAALYKLFVRGDCLLTTDRTAEMVKLTENSFRDVNIAFANELSMICSDSGVDVWKVIEFANRHPRVSILNPGPGVGGHCIAVDPWFIVASAPDTARLIRTAREVNDRKPEYVMEQVERILSTRPDAKIVCLGLTYKPDVDDFRESPALQIAKELTSRHPGQVICVDPFSEALAHSGEDDGSIDFVDIDAALSAADVLLMLVGHSAFRKIARPSTTVTIDTVGFWR